MFAATKCFHFYFLSGNLSLWYQENNDEMIRKNLTGSYVLEKYLSLGKINHQSEKILSFS